MTTADFTIRPYRGPGDARPQYELWLRATEHLTRPWRSCLRNVESQLQQAVKYPRCRLYGERHDGTLAGYIGNHPPFEWIGSQHGPPAQSLGWAIPFGYPWTHPHDPKLEAALYDEMIRVTPRVYAEFQRDIYIQRFRESWGPQLAFLTERGLRLHERIPLLGREVANPGPPPRDLVPITRDDMALVSALNHADDTADVKATADDFQARYDGGWIVNETFWRLGERGVFAVEPRGRWAAVTVLFAHEQAWDETLAAAAAKAATLGVAEIYFTVDHHETSRHAAPTQRGFSEVDAGVYYVRDAD